MFQVIDPRTKLGVLQERKMIVGTKDSLDAEKIRFARRTRKSVTAC
jgi:hypothetical protein